MAFRILILSVIFLAVAAFIGHTSQAEPLPVRQSFTTFPLQIGQWQGHESKIDDRVIAVLGVDDHLNRVYASDSGAFVSVFSSFYQSQRQGRTIHSPLNCLPGAGWNSTERSLITFPVRTASGASRNIEVNRIAIEKGSDRQLVLYWYQSHGRIVANEYLGKLYTVVDAVRLNRTDAALVRVIAPILGDSREALAAAEAGAVQFVQDSFPLLQRFLPE